MEKYQMPSFKANSHGDCELCSEKDVDLFVVPGYMSFCKSCFENEVEICNNCGTIWVSDAIDWTYTDDGLTLCEDCAEELAEESEE